MKKKSADDKKAGNISQGGGGGQRVKRFALFDCFDPENNYMYFRNEFDFWNVHGIMNTSGILHSKRSPSLQKLNLLLIRELFHAYLNIFECHFLRLHIKKINRFCVFMHNGRVPGIANQTRWQFKA